MNRETKIPFFVSLTNSRLVKRLNQENLKTKSNHISSCKFIVYFTRKNLLFLFYTSTFTKHPHQFIYSTHLFNKIFILFTFFSISFPLLSGTNSQTRLLRRAIPTLNQPPFSKIRRGTPTPILQQNHPHPASHHLLRQATNPT